MATNSNFTSVFDKVDDELSCTSKLKFVNYRLKWRIENFDFICKNVKLIESPRFPANNSENTQWYLQLEPTALNNTNAEKFYIHLKNTKQIVREMNVDITFSFSHGDSRFVTLNILKKEQLLWTISGSELYSDFKIVPKNILVTCNLSVYDSRTSGIKGPLVHSPKCYDLIENMKNLMDNEDFKDVIFKVEDKEFSAHKMILAIRSPVFAAMFKNKMSEGLSSVVEIKDTKPSIFQQILSFIYSDNVETLEESALELCYLAEKYELEKLKTMCINSLYKNLSSNIVVDVLEIADLFSILELKDKCLKHLNTEFESLETKEFQQLIQNRPHLISDFVKVQKTVASEVSDDSETFNISFRYEEK